MTLSTASGSRTHDPAGQDLICLAYLSSATGALDATALRDIVEVSARNNAGRRITGMLCHYDGSFLQFLEGPADQVDAALAVIAKDPRHRDLIQMYRSPITARAFGDWSMALLQGEALGEDQQAQVRSLRGFGWSATTDADHRPILQDLLDTFRSWMR